MKKQKQLNKQGFSFVELVVVLAVSAVLRIVCKLVFA